MPRLQFTKCWYRDCLSDNRIEPELLFYKFPKDIRRCELWVTNCHNPELTNIWISNMEHVDKFRICQRHFLKEFLGSTSRLISHAVPIPYGISLDQMNVEKFMSDCANLRPPTTLNILQQPTYEQQNRPPPTTTDTQSISYNLPSDTMFVTPAYEEYNYNQQLTETYETSTYRSTSFDPVANEHCVESNTSAFTSVGAFDQVITLTDLDNPSQQPTTTSLLVTSAQKDHQNTVINPIVTTSNDNVVDAPIIQQNLEIQSQHLPQYVATAQDELNIDFNNSMQQQIIIDQQQQQSTFIEQQETIVVYVEQPRQQDTEAIDCSGNAFSSQQHPPNQTVSMMTTLKEREEHQAHVTSLKQKIRRYQRKLSVTNHRYQKLKRSRNSRSNKNRLLELMNIYKDDFNPCLFEIVIRQIKNPVSKNGNRWSKEIKSFSASVYRRSSSAYKFIRRTIDLPSESIVKDYLSNKRSRLIKYDNNNNSDCNNIDNDHDNIENEDESDINNCLINNNDGNDQNGTLASSASNVSQQQQQQP